MLLYVFCFTVAAVLFFWVKKRLPNPRYPAQRIIDLFAKFFCAGTAMGVLFWGKMYFYEQPYYNVIPIMARLYFAGLCSVIAMVGIFAFAGMRGAVGSDLQ